MCTPKDHAKVLTSDFFSYLAQVKVKIRSKKVTKLNIQLSLLTAVRFFEGTVHQSVD